MSSLSMRKGNPGLGSSAALLRNGNHVRELTGEEPATTNNRMELQAALSALKILKEPCEVTLFTVNTAGMTGGGFVKVRPDLLNCGRQNLRRKAQVPEML